jgi:glycosyltransferase involved in cell wall biosynthesis
MVDDPKDVKNAIADADCYLMHSNEEGFGLVILEAMLNKTPWISRNIAGAKLLSRFGQTYETDDQLVELLQSFERDEEKVKTSYEYVVKSHLISNTVDDILKIIEL